MDPVAFVLITFVGSLLAGGLGAMVGLGGGVILIPFLTLALGVDIRFAVGAGVISVLATSSAGASTFLRLGITNRRLALFLAIATTAGALTGAVTAGFVAAPLLYVIFALVLGYVAVTMFLQRNTAYVPAPRDHPWAGRLRLAGSYPEARRGREVEYRVAGVPPAMLLVYLGGLLSGLLGIGGGAFTVPVMDQIMRLPLKVSAATSNFLLGITATTAAGV
ncbi:MAG: sulfite exporter TauE/SafE family protein, partial [Chloroflexota bacterium]